MQQKTADELISGESHGPLLIAAGVVSPTKGDVTFCAGEQAMVGDGHAVSVAAQISQDLLWATEGALGIDPPLASPKTFEQSIEGEWLGQVGAGTVKGEFAFLVGARQSLQEETAEQSRQHVD